MTGQHPKRRDTDADVAGRTLTATVTGHRNRALDRAYVRELGGVRAALRLGRAVGQ